MVIIPPSIGDGNHHIVDGNHQHIYKAFGGAGEEGAAGAGPYTGVYFGGARSGDDLWKRKQFLDGSPGVTVATLLRFAL